MAQYINTSELASYLQQSLPDASAQLYVDLANGLICDLIGDVSPVPTRVRAIALEAAARAGRNATGETSRTVTIDDRQKTVRRENKFDEIGVFLTDAERDELLCLVDRGAVRVGTIFTPPRFP